MDSVVITPPSAESYGKRLPRSQKLAQAAEIVSTYVRARWLLSRRDLPDAIGMLRGGRQHVQPTDGDLLLTGIRLGRRIGRTLGLLPMDSRCLVRSCVLTSLLARRGIGSTLVIGVKVDPGFKAHAWVECSGVPLLDPGTGDYSRLVEL